MGREGSGHEDVLTSHELVFKTLSALAGSIPPPLGALISVAFGKIADRRKENRLIELILQLKKELTDVHDVYVSMEWAQKQQKTCAAI